MAESEMLAWETQALLTDLLVLGMSPVLRDMTGKVCKDCLFLIHFSRKYDVLILY